MMGKVIRVLTVIFALAPLALVASVYGILPDEVPTKWTFDGGVRYGDKLNLVWISAMSPVLLLMLKFLPKIDPKKNNYDKFKGMYDIYCLITVIFLFGVVSFVVSESFNPGNLPSHSVITFFTGLMFVAFGNMMPKIKSNFFIGIKTPWTLSNGDVWNKTHRLAGFTFFFGGIAVIVMSFVLSEIALYAGVMTVVTVAAVIPCVMSLIWYQKLPEADKRQ